MTGDHAGCPVCKGEKLVCENHPTVAWGGGDGCCGGAGMACPSTSFDIVVGCYVRPVDVSEDPDNVHALEGTVWALERRVDEDTGEIVDHLHTVRVWQGHLEWRMWHADRVGSVTPPNMSTVDGLVRMAGKHLLDKGRRCESRYFGLLHALGGVVANFPRSEAPSIFDHNIELPEGEEAGWERKPAPAHESGVMSASMVGKLLDRLARLAAADALVTNEVRRQARDQHLVYLEVGAVMPLADIVNYQTILERWERQLARREQAS